MKHTIKEVLELAGGISVDLIEAWPKTISRQFGGDPGRGYPEILQNSIDSYDSSVPFHARRIEIITGVKTARMIDYGSGLSPHKLQLLLTLGGTDKDEDQNTIGQFGVGFASIFNPKLGTEWVKVTTKCNGSVVRMTFIVEDPQKPPRIKVDYPKEKIKYSTCVEVKFNNPYAVKKCMGSMEKVLEYYPYAISVNGKQYESAWRRAEKQKAWMFQESYCRGFITSQSWYSNVTLLCKYERVMTMSVDGFMTGGRNMKYNLDDMENVPYVPNTKIVLNSDYFNLTISRDSFYLDYNWRLIKKDLEKTLKEYLGNKLDGNPNKQVVLANQYILRNEIKKYLRSQDDKAPLLVRKLAEAKVYQLLGDRRFYSLKDLFKKISTDTPLYYSVHKQNLQWLGGQFKHDFIVLPEHCHAGGGAPDFYGRLFGSVFIDVVNLDTVSSDPKKLQDLVQRGIVKEEHLSPKIKIVGEKMLNDREMRLLAEIGKLLTFHKVRQEIARNLCIPIRSIKPVFIDVQKTGALVSAGVLSSDGIPLSDNVISNFVAEQKSAQPSTEVDVLLGLALNHPFIKFLVESENPYRAYYSLTFVAHELALSQRLLVPYSQFYHLVKGRIAGGIRRALIESISPDKKAA
ncbi:ATP-binding protein [candidate division KSB1 bacterium]|nr:ATP-binding protein [candidate division KSB1 bacterium]